MGEYSVYLHTNKANGKCYVGITRQNPRRRWQEGHGYDRTYFGNAIKKYGWDGFTHEVIDRALSKEEAMKREIALISLYRSNDRRFGYNIAEGGQTCDVLAGKKGGEHPNHQRVNMIDPATGEVLRTFGAQAETARVMGISRKGITKACRGVCVTYKGYIWEYADKEYEKKPAVGVGKYDHVKIQKAVILEENGETRRFESVKAAGNELGIRPNTISRYIAGIRKDASGRRWSFEP